MLYQIGNKYYLKVQGYYKEVDITIDKDNIVVKAKRDTRIEMSSVKTPIKTIDIKQPSVKKAFIEEFTKNGKKDSTGLTGTQYSK